MRLTANKMNILRLVGTHPKYSLKEIGEELKLSEQTIRSIVYSFREFGYVVYAPLYDRNKGLKWELTGTGKKRLKESLEKNRLRLMDELHIFRPLGKR